MKAYERVEFLIDNGYFTPRTLLDELVQAMSEQECNDNLDHICKMHDIDDNSDTEKH